MEFDAPFCSDEGIENFCKAVCNIDNLTAVTVFGAYSGDDLAGVLAVDYANAHITSFFVDAAFQGRGIGKRLFRHMLGYGGINRVTVNAALYATEIYHRLGFEDAGPSAEKDGVRFTPMRYEKN